MRVGCTPVDLLLRTSGERRFSDFLLWQCAFSINVFEKRCLPSVNICSITAALLSFQIQRPVLTQSVYLFDVVIGQYL